MNTVDLIQSNYIYLNSEPCLISEMTMAIHYLRAELNPTSTLDVPAAHQIGIDGKFAKLSPCTPPRFLTNQPVFQLKGEKHLIVHSTRNTIRNFFFSGRKICFIALYLDSFCRVSSPLPNRSVLELIRSLGEELSNLF